MSVDELYLSTIRYFQSPWVSKRPQDAMAISRIFFLSSSVVVFLGTCLINLAGLPATTEYSGTSYQ